LPTLCQKKIISQVQNKLPELTVHRTLFIRTGQVLRQTTGEQTMTRIGFYAFAGLVLGAIIGKWLPFIASIEAIAGGIIGAILGIVVDKFAYRKNG
jgi:F0F1-type ATP synthase assembly protein I